jgi:hypothetical protein
MSRSSSDQQVACAVCAAEAPAAHLQQVDAARAPGLRPNGLATTTLARLVSECRSCGYAAPDLGQATTAAISLVRSAR